MVLPILGALAGLVKVRTAKAVVDSAVFRLHYRATTTFCFLCCILVAAHDYIGMPISCMADSGLSAAPAQTTFCWVMSTFTIMQNTTAPNSKLINKYEQIYGEAMHGLGTYDKERHTMKFHSYYQWVPFVLFLQGCLFYLPHLVWKAWEKKQVNQLMQGLNKLSFADSSKPETGNIVRYLRESAGLNSKYSVIYLICETLNLVNVLGQMFLLDKFFGGMFWRYGTECFHFMAMDDENRLDPLMVTFPRLTKCTFKTFGPSGTLQDRDLLCVLPQNLLNEKIFLFMWFWFLILAIATVVQLVWLGVVLFSPPARVWTIQRHGKTEFSLELEQTIRQLSGGDFCLLELLGRNLDHVCFQDVLQGVVQNQKMSGNNLPQQMASAPTMQIRPTSLYQRFHCDDDCDPVHLKKQMEMADSSV